MPLIIEAIYEDGVLKTTMPLPFKEHEKVQLEVVQTAPRFAELLGFANDLPDAPADLAAQHDHYLYGTPKR